MKLILSRKGFDTGSGGTPSPIFPDGRMVSLPIPDKQSGTCYGQIGWEGESLGRLVTDLTGGRVRSDCGAHIDPDLVPTSLRRLPGWKPIFGQAGAAQAHLCKQGVGPGDLFLFFGLFRRLEERGGRYAWNRNARKCHMIWGWLQVGKMLTMATRSPNSWRWAEYHPHFQRKDMVNNVVYVASDRLTLGYRTQRKVRGAGAFGRFSPERRLTAAGLARTSTWELPVWFYPSRNRAALSYHGSRQRWQRVGNRTRLETVARGQEFVLDCDAYPEAIPWAYRLIVDG